MIYALSYYTRIDLKSHARVYNDQERLSPDNSGSI